MTHKSWDYLEWDSETISNLWNFASQWSPYQKEYFSRMVGKGIVNFLKGIISIKGNVLDFGCGPGYLVQHMLDNQISCEGIDFSEDSIIAVNARFKDNSLWKGAKVYTNERLPYPDDSFDLIICVETIEHLKDDDRDTIFSEFYRILKPKTGQLFITTPNNEDLSMNMVFCPQCQQVFHKFQHIHSFSQESLFELMENKKFSTTLCNSTTFNYFQQNRYSQVKSLVIRVIKSTVNRGESSSPSIPNNKLAKQAGFVFNQQIGRGPHLFWLGKKADYKDF
jgi:2-polyprenyl-3-methyl-5-hydroxy-6-metoxy-1,4-benzoquinol methylase